MVNVTNLIHDCNYNLKNEYILLAIGNYYWLYYFKSSKYPEIYDMN